MFPQSCLVRTANASHSMNTTILRVQNLPASLVDPFLQYSWFPSPNGSHPIFYQHIHEIISAFAFYQFASTILAPLFCSFLFGKKYDHLQHKKIQINFCAHFVSMLHCFISFICIYITRDIPSEKLNPSSYSDHRSALVCSITMGFYLWDFVQCFTHLYTFKAQYVLHALGSLTLTFLTLRPFLQSWIGRLLVYESSTPFVNINWYIIALSKNVNGFLVPSWFNTLNIFCLITVFFLSRLVWGPYQQYLIIQQLWSYRYEIPVVESTITLIVFITLNTLNIYWFVNMLGIIRKIILRRNKLNKKKRIY